MPATVDRVSAVILDAYRHARPIDAAPADVATLSLEQACAIQDRVAFAMGGAGGWKTGAGSPDAEPRAAPLFASRLIASPAVLPAVGVQPAAVEAELAFRFARALPPRGRAYRAEEVLAAVGALVPAVEVVDSRLGAWAAQHPLWKLADNQSNGHLVLGAEVARWDAVDLLRPGIELWVDGACVVGAADSANAAGDPRRLLTWLANHLASTRTGIAAGAVVTTGTYTGMRAVRAGQQVIARYPGIGEVQVSFTAPA